MNPNRIFVTVDQLEAFADHFDRDIGRRPFLLASVALCQECDHFMDPFTPDAHFDDGEQEYDHTATIGEIHTYGEWLERRPDLFKKHPDGKIGPNSMHHSRRGKVDEASVSL